MTDRDRLINELKKAKNNCLIKGSGGCLACTYRGQADCTLEVIADHLLANGVIVPPCKVGDKLYIIASISQEIIESVVIGMWIVEDSISILTIHGTILNDSLGKTVFLTKEEAEAKLKELGK